MEHLNRRLKSVVRGMGANINPKAIQKAGRSISSVQRVCEVFERQTASSQHSDHHPIPAFGKDFETVLKVLEEEKVFMPTKTGRQHQSFDFECGLMEKVPFKEMVKKIKANIARLT